MNDLWDLTASGRRGNTFKGFQEFQPGPDSEGAAASPAGGGGGSRPGTVGGKARPQSVNWKTPEQVRSLPTASDPEGSHPRNNH